ncbi:right-handed parallel beta-helix repeat-containing protein [Bradyrhizobium sp. GM2.2]|uniref:right-handed parallel beta-helix repeat-containing protein n=1 Tax=Bradyrhizobium sp. GM2.2 TaxID=3156358 RepID=UPI003392DBA0
MQLPKQITEQVSSEKQMWISGYWSRDWAYESVPVTSFNKTTDSFDVAGLENPFQARNRFRFFLENLLTGLKSPGQFVLQSPRRLFYIPYSDGGSEIEIAVSKHVFLLENARNVRIERIQLGQTLAEAIRIANSSDITVQDCAITGTGLWGAVVTHSTRVSFDRCVLSDTAEGGISLEGGNRKALLRGDNTVRDCIITRFGRENPAYRPGVQLQGVGNSILGSLITHGPHSGILVSGNDNTVANNEVANLVTDTNDAGAVYMGRDWTMRGNRISANFIHDIEPQSHKTAVGIYLDDQFSGTTIDANVFYRVNLPILVGGGRDNGISNNIFLAPTKPAILIDDRGVTWQRSLTETDLEQKLQAMPTTSSAWRLHYPSLALLRSDQKGEPGGNEIASNVVAGGQLYRYMGSSMDTFIHLRANETVQFPAEFERKPPRDVAAEFLSTRLKLTGAAAMLNSLGIRERLSRLRYADQALTPSR